MQLVQACLPKHTSANKSKSEMLRLPFGQPVQTANKKPSAPLHTTPVIGPSFHGFSWVVLPLQAGLIGELEGATVSSTAASNSEGWGPAFGILRQLLQDLLHEATVNNSRWEGS